MRENNNLGFTLIELLAVITILGIIVVIAVPSVNKLSREAESNIFKNNSSSIVKNAVNACEMEKAERKKITTLYTIVEGKFDKELDIKGFIPETGYILLNNKCEAAYAFYDKDYSISKNFSEKEPLITNRNKAIAYGLKWQSDKDTLDDTYTRTLDASNIEDESVKVQIGDTPVTNAFDDLDIYKDILPYTDEFGNEFMLIPKFYISKTKEITDTEVIWNYAVSKHKLDDTYYLPSNFVDEGINNDEHIELPYVLVGKYEAGSNGLTGDKEMLVSKSGLDPRVNISIDDARILATNYNNLKDFNGYQQYDIHINDILTMLFVIEFKTMDTQSIMYGYAKYNTIAAITGDSDIISSSSGSISNEGQNSFHYRGIENLWANVSCFIDGLIIDNNITNTLVLSDMISNIYVNKNPYKYSSKDFNDYEMIESYKKLNNDGGNVSESGFDKKLPFINLPIKTTDIPDIGVCDKYWNSVNSSTKIVYMGGTWSGWSSAGMNRFNIDWFDYSKSVNVGARLIKTPLSN